MKQDFSRCAAIFMALFLSSCVLGAGKGPITLSQSATDAFQRYKATPAPLNFLVSEDGRFAHFDFCRMGQQQCVSWTKYDLTEDCERRSRKKCYVFAQDGRVVWDGPVTFYGAASSAPTAAAPAASPAVAAAQPAAPAERPAAPPAASTARYKPPKVGTRVETEAGYYQVTSVDAAAVTTANAANRSARWLGGIFFFDRSSAVVPSDFSAIWSAAPGAEVEVMERRGRDGWRHTIAYLGPDKLSIGGRDYDVIKFQRDRRSTNPSQGGLHDRETLWYAPDVGFLVRRDFKHIAGPPNSRASFAATGIVVP